MLFLAHAVVCAPAMHAQNEAQLDWWDRAQVRQVGPYRIKTDLPAEQANELAAHLHFMHGEFSQRLAALPPRAAATLDVFVFETRWEYVETLRRRYGIDATLTGGMFFVTPGGAGLALWTDGLPERRILHVLQHEGLHQFAYSRFGTDLPVWLNEGLAEVFGAAVIVRGRLLLGQSSARTLESVQQGVELGTAVPFATMLSMSSEAWTKDRRGEPQARYHQARSMVQFLLWGDQGRYSGPFDTYLRLLGTGLPAAHAFERAFDTTDLEGFERRWRAHVISERPSALLTALERIEFLAAGALELRRGGVVAGSIEDLEAALVELGFATTLPTHALEIELRADDASMYRIPQDALCVEQPRFVVERFQPVSRRQERLEAVSPSPALIRTEHLAPANVSVVWLRDSQTGAFGYTVRVD